MDQLKKKKSRQDFDRSVKWQLYAMVVRCEKCI